MVEKGGNRETHDREKAQIKDIGDQPLFNETQILHLLRVEFARARRYRLPLTILLVGVDRLEERNDLHPRKQQHNLLEQLATRVKKELRLSDLLGFYHDTHLLIVLPHTDRMGGGTLAHRLTRQIENENFGSEAAQVNITCSIGLATSDNRDMLFHESLIKKAEKALLIARDQGGRRVEEWFTGNTD